MRKVAVILILILVSCASPQKIYHLKGLRRHLFPAGTYHHSIRMEWKNQKARNFKAIVKVTKDSILVVGLSPFQNTMFRIRENRKTKHVQTEVFFKRLKEHQDKIEEAYSVLSVLFNCNKGCSNSKGVSRKVNRAGFLEQMQIRAFKKQIQLVLKDYDKNQIPETIEMLHSDFTVKVEIEGYEIEAYEI